ncbi:MAG: chorismate synthase [Chloroflexi bacterium RBG_13_53_26]|nr:MAG: chorismate synthase [Chloroflexi bacterium RBG_13_53_26]
MPRFRFLTAGESHGKGLTVIIDGVPAGLTLDEDQVASELKRRQCGYGRGSRMKIEQDRAEILSGVRHGVTTGSPISLLIWNRDWENWREVMAVSAAEEETARVTRPRPGHADLAGAIKYGLNDIRPVMERASARETAARVAAGAVARRFVEEIGVEIHSHTLAIGGEWTNTRGSIDWQQVERSAVRCADAEAEKGMIAAIDRAISSGDTVGGVCEIIASGVPVGLGSHVQWDRRLDGIVAQAVMSINSVKGVEIGDGFKLANLKGSEAHDVIEVSQRSPYPWSRPTNHAGGIEGGISNGEPVIVRAAVKPIPTLGKPLPSLDLSTWETVEAHFERSDVCVVPSVGVIAEAMLAIVLADALLEKFGGDSMEETKRNHSNYLDSIQRRR